jgi:hypothetical protein
MVSGAERVRGVRYPLVMPSQIAVVIKPVVASSSSGSRSPGSSCTVKPLETGADPTRREVGGTGAAPREIATQSRDRLRDEAKGDFEG